MNVGFALHGPLRPIPRRLRRAALASVALSLAAVLVAGRAAAEAGAAPGGAAATSSNELTISKGAVSCPDKPVYPEQARRAKAEGVTRLIATAGEDGALAHVHVFATSGTDRVHSTLDQVAVSALWRCRFVPPTAGKSVVVDYLWVLEDASSPFLAWLANLDRSEGERQMAQARKEALSGNRAPLFALQSKAAQEGDARAQIAVGHAYLFGEGVARDPEQALRWLQKASDQGASDATFTLSVLAASHVGADATPERHWALLTLAAERGLPQAQFDLANAYAAGMGVPKDAAMALRWNIKAAESGMRVANLRIASAYEQGLGVEADPVQALVYYLVADDQGVLRAREQADALAPRMTPEERGRAREALAHRGIAFPY